MSARSCLLCGRALSRWTGSGEEFCSREHRNQYRLRRSMDRLQEANKVASVMRRRESPRPLKASRLINGGPQEPRAFTDPQTTPPQPPSIPQLAPASAPHMAPTGDLVALPLSKAGARKRTLAPAPIAARTAGPVLVPLRVVNATPGPQSAPAIQSLEQRAATPETRRRVLASVWRTSTRPVLRAIVHRASQVCTMAESARPAALGAAAAAKGWALRVSLSVGFRVPEWKLRVLLFRVPVAPGMTWPGFHPLQRRPFGASAVQTAAGLAATDLVAAPEMRIPAAPFPIFQTAFRWPETKGISLAFVNPAVLHRSAIVPFTSSEEFSSKERPYEYRN